MAREKKWFVQRQHGGRALRGTGPRATVGWRFLTPFAIRRSQTTDADNPAPRQKNKFDKSSQMWYHIKTKRRPNPVGAVA